MRLKSSNSEIILLIVILIIGSGVLYYKFILSIQIEQIKQLNTEIDTAHHEIRLKNVELNKVASIKEEISQIDMNINTSKMKILPYPDTAKKLILLQDYVKLNNLFLEKMELNEPVEKSLREEDGQKYAEVSIHLEVYGRYEDLKIFIEQMKGSMKPFVINQIEITPKEEDRTDQGILIQATMDLYTYTLLDHSQKEEDILHYNFMEYEYRNKNPFKAIPTIDEKAIEEITEAVDEEISSLEENSLEDADLSINEFKIAIKDAYASGDNFYIIGPGDPEDYTTVQTSTVEPVNFYLTVEPSGYEYAVEARDQERKSYRKGIKLNQCRVIVDSTVMAIRKDQELNTGIYIENNTGNLLTVELRGSFLDKIHIYSSNRIQIHPGEVKENISVQRSR